MEHPSSPLPPPPCILSLAIKLLQAGRHVYHFSRQRHCPRVGYELHHQEAPRLRILSDDAPATHRCGTKVQIRPRKDNTKRTFPLLNTVPQTKY